MKRDLREYQKSLNLIKPSPLRVIVILKTTWSYILALALLISAIYGFLPDTKVLANPEVMSSVRTEEPENQDSMFNVTAVHPENQIDVNVGFFYLDTNPGGEQLISVRMQNFTGEYLAIEVAIHLATTDYQGRVHYLGANEPPDATLPHNIEDLIHFEPFIQLAPYVEEEEFLMSIRMPATPYQGVLAGGLTFTLVDYPLQSHLITILLRQDGFVDPQLVLADVTSEVVGGQSVINANLRNVTATFVGQMNITTEVRDNAGELVFSETRQDMQMAPNSSFLYEVGLGGLEMTSELYEVTFIIVSGADSWELTWAELEGTGTFVEEIHEEVMPEPIVDAEEEEEAVPEPPAMLDEENLYNILLLLMVIAGIFVLAMIVVSIVLKRKEKTENVMELQKQILATLMSDEEEKIKSTEEKQSPKRARPEKSNDRVLDELEDIVNKKENDSGRREKSADNVKEKTLEDNVKPSSQKAKVIDRKEKEIEKKEREIVRKQRELENKEKTLRAKEKTIAEKAKTVEEKEKTVEEKVKTVEEKEKTVEEKEKTVEEKEKTVEEKQKEIERKEEERKIRIAEKVKTYERKKEEWEIEI
jgi:hypothetical protein